MPLVTHLNQKKKMQIRVSPVSYLNRKKKDNHSECSAVSKLERIEYHNKSSVAAQSKRKVNLDPITHSSKY